MLGIAFAVPFFKLFPTAPASCGKEVLIQFLLHFTSIHMSSKVSQIFKILFQTGDINIFVVLGAFFSRYAHLKSSFSDKKTSAVKSDTLFSREAIKINLAKY